MIHDKLKSREELAALIEEKKQQGLKVVFTNGCFDLLHVGHVRLLEASRAMGDILVVGVNSDESVRRYKGPSRPVVGERERAEILCALHCTNYVVIFDEDTPVETLTRLKPHIHVKGGDYDMEKIPEAPVIRSYGGELRSFPFIEGHSTTRLIESAGLSSRSASPLE